MRVGIDHRRGSPPSEASRSSTAGIRVVRDDPLKLAHDLVGFMGRDFVRTVEYELADLAGGMVDGAYERGEHARCRAEWAAGFAPIAGVVDAPIAVHGDDPIGLAFDVFDELGPEYAAVARVEMVRLLDVRRSVRGRRRQPAE